MRKQRLCSWERNWLIALGLSLQKTNEISTDIDFGPDDMQVSENEKALGEKGVNHHVTSVATSKPFITVGILTKNSIETISDTLKSVVTQTLSSDDWQCIVVDHDSNDGTRQIISEYSAKYQNISLVTDPENNLAKSRQKIVDWSRTDWIAFVDSDVTLPPQWLERACLALRALDGFSVKVTGVGSPIRLNPRSSELSCLPILQTHFLGHFGTEQMALPTAPRQVTHLPTAASLIRRDAIVACGGFDSDFGDCGEDLELGERLSRQGHRFWILPELEVDHQLSCRSRRQWLMRAFRFGRARMKIASVHPHLFLNPRTYLPVLYVALHLGLVVGAFALIGLWSLIALPILLWAEVLIIWAFFATSTQDSGRLSAAALAFSTHQAFAWGQFVSLLAVPFYFRLPQQQAQAEEAKG